MSKGFIKDDDQEEIPIVPPRADLPPGIINYITQVGMDALLEEKNKLQTELNLLDRSNEKEYRIAANYINEKLLLLNNRIAESKIVKLNEQPHDQVMFGANVTLRIGDEPKLQTYQIVGVDEANLSKQKISFISPVAKILLNKKVGDKAILKLPAGDRIFEVVEIKYG